jgi:hypothetical protein
VTDRVISSDGSEEHVAIHRSEDGEGFAVGPRISVEDRAFVHEDFQGLQDRRHGVPIGGEFYRFKRTDEPPSSADGAAISDRS